MKNYLRYLSPVLLMLVAVLFGGGKILAADVTTTQSSFTATSANNIGGDKNVSYSTAKGGGTAAPRINDNEIYLYQNSSGTGGGTITIKANNSVKIKSVIIGSSMKTKVAYTIDNSTKKSTTTDLADGGKYTADGLSASSVTFYCMGDSKTTRLYVNFLSVTYETESGAVATTLTFPHTSYDFKLGQDDGTAIINDNTAVLTDNTGNVISGTIIYSVLKESVEGLAVLGGEETESTIMVDTNKEGTATIQASYVGETDKYQAASAVYTIIVSKVKTQTALSFGEAYDNKTIDVELGDEFTAPTATLTPSVEGATIKYSSSAPKVATVDEATGAVTLVAKGTAIITATYEGNDDYAASTAFYTLNVTKTVAVEDGVFDFTDGTIDYGSGLTPRDDYGSTEYDANTTWTAGNVIITTSKGTGNGVRWWNSTSKQDPGNTLRFYKGSKFIVSVPEGYYITNIAITGAYSFTADCGSYNSDSGKWNGVSSSVTFTYGAKSGNIAVKTISVDYIKAETLTTSAKGYATYAADYAVNYSELGLTAYTITMNADQTEVTASEFTGVVPTGKAVLVKGEGGKAYTLAPATADADDTFATSLQTGATTADGTQYGFTSAGEAPAFKKVTMGQSIAVKKGYLVLANTGAGAKLNINFGGEATGIDAVTAAANSNAAIYNLAGQRVDKAYKGIVIVNGKKYLNK